MPLVTFYALTQPTRPTSGTDINEIASELAMAAELLIDFVAKRKKVSVLTASQIQAEAFDELIWQFPADKFIPHNLYGEGPSMGTPVEIIWHSAFLSMLKLRNTAVVINLSQHYIENIQNINHIIDFVPVNEDEKAQARERYKKYKQAGCQLEYKTA
jgi:DNA polymerase-3 subunit chi